MAQPTMMTPRSRCMTDGSLSRRAVMAGSTGLVAAAGLAVRSALAPGHDLGQATKVHREFGR